MTETDHELWRLAARGDDASFGRLFERHVKAVYNLCFRLTASWSDAEDLTSTVFLQAWRKRADVQIAGDSVLPWLLAVATNVVRNEWRSRRRRMQLVARIAPTRAVDDHAEDVAGRVDDERRMAQVLPAVRRLPPAEQQAVALCIWAGVGYPDAAAVLGISESSVRARVSRARSRLAREFTAVVDHKESQ